MRALKGDVLRGPADARTKLARRYRVHYEDLQRQFPNVPAFARRWLREGAYLVLDLETLNALLGAATARRQQREASRLRRQIGKARAQLGRIEDRLERLATVDAPSESAAAWAARHTGAQQP